MQKASKHPASRKRPGCLFYGIIQHMEQTNTHPRTTPKDFFLWAGAMISLYWTVVAFIFLVFNYIDFVFPNVLAYRVDPYQGGMPYEMASILVLVPVYLALMYLIRRDIRHDASRKEVWVRRWAIILTLFVAGATIVADIITLLTAFFSGEELTTAFLLKVVAVLLVAAAGFLYFTLDLRGYWDVVLSRTRVASAVLAVVALIAIVAGFFIVGTPQAARLMRLDSQRVSDLQSIQWQVVSYWQSKEKLPTTLAMLADPISGYQIPVDPASSAPYEYTTSSALSFQLCATFNRVGENSVNGYVTSPEPASIGSKGTSDSWSHEAGHVCFTRTIDPELYPPFPKTTR